MKYLLHFLLSFLPFVIACQNPEKKAALEKKLKQGNEARAIEANNFLIDVANGVYSEVELSRLALKKASLTKVREFAKNVITDYDKNLAGLQALADRKKIKIILKLDKALEEKISNLAKLNGPEFDKAYIGLMVKDSEASIIKFRIQLQKGKDIETKAFASGKLNIVTHHLDMARTLHDSMLKS